MFSVISYLCHTVFIRWTQAFVPCFDCSNNTRVVFLWLVIIYGCPSAITAGFNLLQQLLAFFVCVWACACTRVHAFLCVWVHAWCRTGQIPGVGATQALHWERQGFLAESKKEFKCLLKSESKEKCVREGVRIHGQKEQRQSKAEAADQ